MTYNTVLALVLMALAGVASTIQPTLNAGLGRHMGSPMAAAVVSFIIGFIPLLLIALAIGEGPHLMRATTAPFWLLMGGVLGAFYVFSGLWSVPVLGVLTTISMLIFGQMMASLVLDTIGGLGLPVRELSLPRLVAPLLVLGGVILSRW